MIACTQLYTGSCFTVDVSEVAKVTQEVERLLGYECSQVNSMATTDMCNVRNDTCEGVFGLDYCFYIWYGVEDVCP